jgi:hypothetical protein
MHCRSGVGAGCRQASQGGLPYEGCLCLRSCCCGTGDRHVVRHGARGAGASDRGRSEVRGDGKRASGIGGCRGRARQRHAVGEGCGGKGRRDRISSQVQVEVQHGGSLRPGRRGSSEILTAVRREIGRSAGRRASAPCQWHRVRRLGRRHRLHEGIATEPHANLQRSTSNGCH